MRLGRLRDFRKFGDRYSFASGCHPSQTLTKREEHYIFYPVSSFKFFFMVLLVGASCMDNAYRNLSYTTRKRLKKDIIAIRGLSLNPKSINPQKILQNLLKKGFLESKKIITCHDVVSNTICKHRSKRDSPCEIDRLLELLTGLKKNIDAIYIVDVWDRQTCFNSSKTLVFSYLMLKDG